MTSTGPCFCQIPVEDVAKIARLALRCKDELDVSSKTSIERCFKLNCLLFSELDNIFQKSRLPVIAEALGNLHESTVSCFGALLEDLEVALDKLEIEKSRVKAYMKQEQHPMRNAPEEVKRKYFKMPEKKMQLFTEMVKDMDFGDKDEAEQRRMIEDIKKKKIINKLLERVESGLPIDIYELEDIISLIEFCNVVADKLKRTTQDSIENTRDYLRRLDDFDQVDLTSVEKMEEVRNNIEKFIVQNNIRRLHLPNVEVGQFKETYLSAEKCILEKFDEKQRDVAIKALTLYKKMKEQKSDRSTMTAINSQQISQMMDSKEGKLRLKISNLEDNINQLNKEIKEAHDSRRSLEIVCEELMKQMTRYSEEVYLLMASRGFKEEANQLVNKNKKVVEDITKSFQLDKFKQNISMEFQSLIQRTVADFAHLTIEVVSEIEDTQKQDRILKKYKEKLKETAKKVLIPEENASEERKMLSIDVEGIIRQKIDEVGSALLSNRKANTGTSRTLKSLKSNRAQATANETSIDSESEDKQKQKKSVKKLAADRMISPTLKGNTKKSRPQLEVLIDKKVDFIDEDLLWKQRKLARRIIGYTFKLQSKCQARLLQT